MIFFLRIRFYLKFIRKSFRKLWNGKLSKLNVRIEAIDFFYNFFFLNLVKHQFIPNDFYKLSTCANFKSKISEKREKEMKTVQTFSLLLTRLAQVFTMCWNAKH